MVLNKILIILFSLILFFQPCYALSVKTRFINITKKIIHRKRNPLLTLGSGLLTAGGIVIFFNPIAGSAILLGGGATLFIKSIIGDKPEPKETQIKDGGTWE